MAVMEKMILKFTPQEFNAIVQLSIAEHREPRQQAAYLIRQQLEQAGLLQPVKIQDNDIDNNLSAKIGNLLIQFVIEQQKNAGNTDTDQSDVLPAIDANNQQTIGNQDDTRMPGLEQTK